MRTRNAAERARGLVWAAAASACLLPTPIAAFEDVTVALRDVSAAPSEQEDFIERLRAASLLVSLVGTEGLASRDVVAAARSDYTRLVEALFSEGFYSTVVNIRINGREAADISPLNVPERIETVDITVAPGPRFTFGRADIAPLAPGTTLPEGFAVGQPARADLVRGAATTAVNSWRDIGYPKTEISDQSVRARHRVAQLDVAVEIAPGPRLRFGNTPVRGETRVSDARIRQIAGLPKGEYYSPEAVRDAGARLRRTGTFRSVRLVEGEALPDGTLDMQIVVTDREPRRIGAGAEISSTDGVTLTGFWLHRNILGGAESLRFDAELLQLAGVDSAADFVLSGRFERPAVYGPDTHFYIESEIAYYDEPDFLSLGASLGTGFSREVTDTLTIETGIEFNYSEVTDRFRDGDPTRELFYVSLPTDIELDRRNDELDATSGYFVEVLAEPFVETLNDEVDNGFGIKLDVDARVYRSLGDTDRFVLAGRAYLGSLIGPEADVAPPGFLYYSGGGGSVRGQPYQSLSIDYGDVTLGGRSFAGLSGEFRFGIAGNIGGVVFADAGWLSGESDFSDPVDHAGAGIGVRYKTPVGPIRFDIAGPIGGDTGDGIQYYIGIGQAF